MDSEVLGLFEDALQRFNRERYAPAQLVEQPEGGGSRPHWREMAELGWFDLAVSDEARPEIVPLLSVFRAAGEGLWREPITCVFGEAALVAANAVSSSLRQQLREGLASGRASLAYADREAGDAWTERALVTQAQRRGEGFAVSGRKVAVIDDAECSGYLVTARSAGTGSADCYLIESGATGLEIERYPTVDGRTLADLRLEQAPARFICPLDLVAPARDWASLLATGESVGIMRGALRDTLDYLRQRRQFGRPLIEFQVLQHRLADMSMLLRETDAFLAELAADLDAGRAPDRRSMLCLRAQTSRALREVTREALQMHGGMGITQECRVSHYYRRALTLESLHGSEAWALDQLASL